MYRPDPLRAMPGGVVRHIGGEVSIESTQRRSDLVPYRVKAVL